MALQMHLLHKQIIVIGWFSLKYHRSNAVPVEMKFHGTLLSAHIFYTGKQHIYINLSFQNKMIIMVGNNIKSRIMCLSI